jgi:hypothetical protein
VTDQNHVAAGQGDRASHGGDVGLEAGQRQLNGSDLQALGGKQRNHLGPAGPIGPSAVHQNCG